MTSDQKETSGSVSRTSKKKSSQLFDYLKIKETDRRISLYTHIQGLLDLFIFQNPTRPVEYFEYYSEQLKLNYGRPRRNPDLDFSNNIELNVYNKLTNIYKDIGVGKLEDDASIDLFNYKEEDLPLDEYEADARKANEPVAIVIQDLSNINYAFNKAGCGITNDEACLIGIIMNQIASLNKFKNIRYWGQIFGLKRNYYIVECEWQNKELEYKLKILNKLMNVGNYMDGYENMYEHEQNTAESEMTDMEMVEQSQEASKTQSSAPTKTFGSVFNESLLSESVFQHSNVLSPAGSSTADDHEMFGFGTNKKSYFVTNRLYDEWIELPLLRPHHVIQSRNVNRYFVGDLDAPVESYPLFQGLEKHYLRAQIARITAATQISPRDYFVLDRHNGKSNVWNGLSPFQSKVLSQKWVHDYVANEYYNPPSFYDLLHPTNWVHHAPLITEDGVTRAWAKLRESRNDGDVKALRVQDFGNEEINSALDTTVAGEQPEDEQDDSTDPAVEYPDLLVALSDDAYADGVSPWKFETTNPFDGSAAHVSVRSNLWPGAFAVARESLTDCTYSGWGQKWRNRCPPTPMVRCDEFQTEYPAEGTTEANDPTYEDEQAFYTKIRLLKEEGREKKRKPIFSQYLAVNEDDEERVLKNIDYN